MVQINHGKKRTTLFLAVSKTLEETITALLPAEFEKNATKLQESFYI
jgi:hypothetical protein